MLLFAILYVTLTVTDLLIGGGLIAFLLITVGWLVALLSAFRLPPAACRLPPAAIHLVFSAKSPSA